MALEILTHTKRRDFKNCRRYYLHRHVQHLTPRIQKRGRRRGTIFGETIFDVLEAFKEGATPGIMGDADLSQFVYSRVHEQYEELRETGNLDAAVLAELDVEETKMAVMCEAYIKRYGIDARREIQFDLPLRNPRTGKTSRAFRRGGKIDGAVIVGPKRVRIIEDKLVSQIQKAMIDRLPLDDQISEYVEAFLTQGWEAEVSYRHTRFPGIEPKPAKQFKTKDDYPGETLDEFADRLWQDVTVERPDFYFDEQILWFPKEHLDDFRNGRWGVAQEIIAARRVARRHMNDELFDLRNIEAVQQAFPMNPSRCWEYGGCEFIPLCTRQDGAEALYVIQEDNPELTRGKEDEAVTSEYGNA